MAAWVDELTLISQQPPEERVNAGGFENEPQESARTVFCNKKSVGYSEYFKSQQTGKVVEAKCEVHKAELALSQEYNEEPAPPVSETDTDAEGAESEA